MAELQRRLEGIDRLGEFAAGREVLGFLGEQPDDSGVFV